MILRNLLIQSSPVKDMEDSKLLIKNNNLMDCNKDKRIHQLNKLCDETLERNNIFPVTVTDAVFDKKTGNSLKSMLLQNNNIFLPFKGSAAATRITLPFDLRRKGIIISYINMDDKAITEKLINVDDISDAYIALDANWEEITIGSVVNYPDEEDITAIDDKLKFKDKQYVSDSYLGLGRKYLRLNIIDGKNVLTQNMIDKENTIYNIQYDYDLNGRSINLPNNCVLEFTGGSLNNGTITGNNSKIKGDLIQIFKINTIINGNWDIIESYPEWFGAKGDGVTDDTVALQTCINYFNVIKLSSRTYITKQLIIPSFKNIIGEGKNSIIKANPNMPLTNNYLIRTKDGGSGIRISNLKIICGNTSNEADYKIGGIGLISTANINNDQWDTRNIIENVEILNCYAASIYIGTYQRENKIQNCFISNTTNNGINCQGTDNMINGCTIAGSHLSGIMLQGNNRLSNTKLFGCSKSEVTKKLYALDIFGSKCNVSNVELQQNYYGGVVVRGNSNYVQVTNDNNGSGNPAGITIGASVIGNYNTVIVTSYNFSFHDDAYERYFVSTNWSTVGNNIIVNGTPLKNNKMSSLPPWSIDNICNNISWNGYNLTQTREVSFDKLAIPYKYRTNGTGSFHTNDTGLSFNITSVTAVNVDALSYSIPIYNATKVDPDGCFSIKARFHKNNDADDSIYPTIRINTIYKNSAGKSITRTDQNTIINLLDNKDSLDVYTLSSYHHLSDKAVSISSISVELAVRSTKVLSNVSIDAYFDDIKIGATTSGDTVRSANTNIDGTNGNKVVITNKTSDFTLENVIYKIVSDINLGTASLEIPANCTLDFQGGSFSNGVITGNGTKIKAGLNKIFDTNITLSGSWDVNEAYPEWFGATIGSSDSRLAIQLCLNSFNTTKLSSCTYTLNSYSDEVVETRTCLIIPNGHSLIGNRIYELAQTDYTLQVAEGLNPVYMIRLESNSSIKNLYICGNTISRNNGAICIGTNKFAKHLFLENVLTRWGAYGFSLKTFLSTVINCQVANSNIGFRIYGDTPTNNFGTSTTLIGCYGIGIINTCYQIESMIYSSIVDCACDSSGLNTDGTISGNYIYDIINSRNISINNCGIEICPLLLQFRQGCRNIDINGGIFTINATLDSNTLEYIKINVGEKDINFNNLRILGTNGDPLGFIKVRNGDFSCGYQFNNCYFGNTTKLILGSNLKLDNINIVGNVKVHYNDIPNKGLTSTRPSLTNDNLYNGFMFFDLTLNKYICWNGTAWTNLDGSALS